MTPPGIYEKYTLIQHTGYSVGGNPQFKNAVEERSVTPAEARRVKRAGGCLFDSYTKAHEAAQAENYPPDVVGLIPKARGTFLTHKLDGIPLYRLPTAFNGEGPETVTDVVAALSDENLMDIMRRTDNPVSKAWAEFRKQTARIEHVATRRNGPGIVGVKRIELDAVVRVMRAAGLGVRMLDE